MGLGFKNKPKKRLMANGFICKKNKDSDIGIDFDTFQLVHFEDLGRTQKTFKQNIVEPSKRSPIQFWLRKSDGEYFIIIQNNDERWVGNKNFWCHCGYQWCSKEGNRAF